ncbi:MAG: hypothetical protein D6813_02050 [Calditrichaeota bacterium]|nr:MAG: hypothetical protein D6813_02050 [Calditrichota bacterium]
MSLINFTNPEVGQELLAFCKKCKADMVHVVTVVKGGAIKKVMCKGCFNTHTYQAPSKSLSKKRARTKTSSRKSQSWTTLMGDIEENEVVEYDFSKDLSNVKAIRHKQFGVGVITKVISSNKIEVLFHDEKKILVHNWNSED